MESDTPGPVLGVLSTPYPYGEELEKERPPDSPIRAEMEWIKNHHCGDAVTKGTLGSITKVSLSSTVLDGDMWEYLGSQPKSVQRTHGSRCNRL